MAAHVEMKPVAGDAIRPPAQCTTEFARSRRGRLYAKGRCGLICNGMRSCPMPQRGGVPAHDCKCRPDAIAPAAKGRSGRQLDEQDEAIIAVLREDGRIAIRELAQKVGLTEATVRARIRRLETSGSIRIVAKRDLGAMGYPYTALVGIRIRGRTIDEVGQDLLAIPEVISILSVIRAQRSGNPGRRPRHGDAERIADRNHPADRWDCRRGIRAGDEHRQIRSPLGALRMEGNRTQRSRPAAAGAAGHRCAFSNREIAREFGLTEGAISCA